MKREKGMTMVELVIAVAISGIIVAFLGTAVYQITTVSDYGNSQLTAYHELQNASYWLKLDGQEAMSAAGGSQLVLTLSDGSTVTYSLAGTELRRSSGGLYTVLARNISSATFTINERMVTMNLTSDPPGRYDVSATGTYMVYLRLEGGG